MEEFQLIKSPALWHSLQLVWRGVQLDGEALMQVNAFKVRCRRQQWNFEMLNDGETIRILKKSTKINTL